MLETKSAFRSMMLMALLSLVAKILGFIREVLIASKFGSGLETDAFFVALTATSMITMLFGTAINTTMIPLLSEIENNEGKVGKVDHTNNILNIIFMVSLFLVLIGWVTTPYIIKIIAKGFVGEQYWLTIKLMRLGLPVMVFSGIIWVLRGYLQSESMFIESSIVNFPHNFVYIIFLLLFSNKFGIVGLMITSVLAVASQIFIQLAEIKKVEFKYKLIINLRDSYIKKLLLLSGPIFIGVAINDLNAIVDRNLASSLIAGSISALNYANKLNNLILGVFITAITTVIFPLLSKEANSDNINGVKSTMAYGINLILLITVPATIGLIVLATPIVKIAFQRGEFDSTATIMTSQALIFYSIGLVAMALRLLITRVYYSLQDTKTPMINGAISVGFNIILNLILVKYMDHMGLALATSIATTIATVILLYGLKKKIGALGTKEYVNTFIKTGLASAIMGVVAYTVYHSLYVALGDSKLYNLISLLVAVGLAIIVYVVFCYIFKIEEIRDIIDKIKLKLFK